MNFSIQKVKGILRSITTQIILVFLAFAVMVITTYLYVSKTEREHLKVETENAIARTQANITAVLQEPKTTLGVITETMRIMIEEGEPFETIAHYISHTTKYMLAEDPPTMSITGVYGVFDVFGGKFHTGADWTPPDDYVPEDQPWYATAVKANGEIGITEPFIDMELGVVSMTYARRIFDEEGRPLGVVCLDLLLDRVIDYAIDTYVTEGSYGILVDKEFNVMAHPHPAYFGKSIRLMNDGESIAEGLLSGELISERRATDYKGNASILFIRQLQNGWYLAVIAYAKEYYQSLENMAFLLGSIGLLMAIILNVVLIQMAAAKDKADIKSQQKTNFLATISHEIRTPMNAILGITEIQMQSQALSKEVSEALTKIYHSGYSLLGIINDILDLSKIEAGKLELVLVKYDVANLVHDTAQLNMMRIGSRAIKFDVQVDPFTPAELFGDELRIKQILNNLLSNAFKYTDKGEVTLSVSAKYEDRVKEPYVALLFTVRDTGQGLTKEQSVEMFDEYSRFNLDANRMTEGAGLGMSITKRLVDMMNGSISVESEQGKGTTISVRLPQKNVGAAPMGEETVETLKTFRFSNVSQMKAAQIVREPMPYGSVLIVDDVETNLYVAKGLMVPYDLTIDTAESGREAIDKIKSGKKYDIVFMDHMMPQMDGIEATKIIRGMGYTNPIIALTANAVAGQAEVFLSSGFDDFISKPVDIRQLNALLNKLIRDKQPPEVLEAAAEKAALSGKGAADVSASSSIDPELARTFVRDAQKIASVLEVIYEKRSALEEEEIQLYTINTHAIKSALANVGEMALSDFARKLETAGREQDLNLISAETPVFLDELQEAIQRITPPEEDDKAENEDLDFLQEKLLLFRAACVVYDKKAAKEVIIDLKKKKWSRETKDLLNTLAEHLLHSDFEEAANIARDYDLNSAS
jgi:signal transduction histidine kinase/DNA-binding response OmpR family regulator